MKVLIDTHVLLWWLADDASLPHAARTVIASPENEVVVSAASAWEIAIKQALGRLDAPDDLLAVLNENDFDTLPMTASHALAAGRLPPHHTDPFDRMLIAQASVEDYTLITVDTRFNLYDIALLSLAEAPG
ncbi:MAG: type II toxin-antitoxin system VapC family toxin [Acidimicrobiales bacterium]